MAALVRLPELQAPTGLDWTPVGNALTELRKANEFQQQQGLNQQKVDIARGTLQLAQDKADVDQEQEQRQRLAGIGQAIDQMPDDGTRANAWNQFVQSHPAIGPTLERYGQPANDHINGPKFLVAEALGVQDPAKQALTAA